MSKMHPVVMPYALHTGQSTQTETCKDFANILISKIYFKNHWISSRFHCTHLNVHLMLNHYPTTN